MIFTLIGRHEHHYRASLQINPSDRVYAYISYMYTEGPAKYIV